MVDTARVIQSVTVQKGSEEQKFAVGEEVNGEVVIEIVDKSTVGTIEFDLLDEDGNTIFTIEKLPCQVEWKTIAVDGPAGITPAMLLEAYEKTGLKPIRGVFYNGSSTCACGFGALSVASGREATWHDAMKYGTGTYGTEYAGGFMRGFDGFDLIEEINADHKRGYEDGKAAWEAVKHLSERRS